MSKKGIIPKINIDPIDKIVNERQEIEHKQKLLKEQRLEGKDNDDSAQASDIHRVAFNMPKYIYDTLNPKLKKQKITMTNYILTLIRKDIGE